MFLGLGIPITRLSDGAVPSITAVSIPTGQLRPGENANADLANFATFDNPLNYAIEGGTISSVDYQINVVSDPGTGVVSDLDQPSFFVTASTGTTARFAISQVVYAPPVATGGLADQSFVENTGVQTYNASGDFTGSGLTYTVNSVTGVTINPTSGVVSVDTDIMSLQDDTPIIVTATNSGGSDQSGFSLSITEIVDVVVSGTDGEAVLLYPDGTSPSALLSITIASGPYAGGPYTQRVTDSAALTVGMVEAAPTPIILPVITGTAQEDETLTLTPGFWLYAGADPGDQTWSWINNTDGATGETDLDYVVLTSDLGDTLKVTETFGAVSIDSANTATVTAGVPPFPDAFVDADWTVATGGTGTPNSLFITVASLPSDNGNAITDIEYDVDGANIWTSLGISTATTATIQMVAPETEYDIRLRAVNSNGAADPGNTETATSGAGVPDVIADFTPATGTSSAEVDITIGTLPDDNGSAITDIEYDVDGDEVWTSLGISTATTATVTMAAPGTSYEIRVRAVNAVGVSADSAPETVVSGAAPAFDPEAGLSLTSTFTEGAIIENTEVERTQPGVFACDFIGLTTAIGGIWEQGADTIGACVYMDGSGQIVVRCGASGNLLPTSDAAYVIAPAPSGDGTLVWQVTPGMNTVRVWWNGVELGAPVARASGSGEWAGTALGKFIGDEGVTHIAGYPTSDIPSYTTVTGLRYYQNQTVS